MQQQESPRTSQLHDIRIPGIQNMENEQWHRIQNINVCNAINQIIKHWNPELRLFYISKQLLTKTLKLYKILPVFICITLHCSVREQWDICVLLDKQKAYFAALEVAQLFKQMPEHNSNAIFSQVLKFLAIPMYLILMRFYISTFSIILCNLF